MARISGDHRSGRPPLRRQHRGFTGGTRSKRSESRAWHRSPCRPRPALSDQNPDSETESLTRRGKNALNCRPEVSHIDRTKGSILKGIQILANLNKTENEKNKNENKEVTPPRRAYWTQRAGFRRLWLDRRIRESDVSHHDGAIRWYMELGRCQRAVVEPLPGMPGAVIQLDVFLG